MLSEFTEWLVNLVKAFFGALWNFVVDAFIGLVELLVTALVGLVSAIPVPSFMSMGLQSFYGQLDPGIVYLCAASGLPGALAIIGLGYGFRLVRKFVTLFQW